MNEPIIMERIGALDAKVSAAHSRVDKVEILVKDSLKEINDELKKLTGWMNRSLGWAAALLFVGGLVGGIASAVISKLLK